MPEIIQLTRWFGCMVSSRLMAWVVLLILSSGTSLKRVRRAFTNLWSKVPWESSRFHFETVQVIPQTPKQISIFFFQSVGHWVQLQLKWNRELLRKGIDRSLIHPEARVDIPLSSTRIQSCCRWHRRGSHPVWSPTGFAYRSQSEKLIFPFIINSQ